MDKKPNNSSSKIKDIQDILKCFIHKRSLTNIIQFPFFFKHYPRHMHEYTRDETIIRYLILRMEFIKYTLMY